MPEIPTGGNEEMTSQVQSIGTQLSHIAARFMSTGQHDAGIACAKAVKALEPIPDLVHQNTIPGTPPNMGAPNGGPGAGMLPGMGMMAPPPMM